MPLALRLPNGPASFVGRAREVQWLQQAITRAPVTLICGAGGVGKSAIALHVLHHHLREHVERGVYLDLRPDEPADQLRMSILTALSRASDQPIAEACDPEEVVAQALDLAEAAGWLIFVDDLHHTERSEANELLRQIASYARRSRWVFTSRHNPALDVLASQTLELEGMQQRDLVRLLATWGYEPAASHAREALLRSGGSPWLMMQLASGQHGEAIMDRDLLLGTFSEVAQEFARALSVLRDPIALEDCAAFAPIPEEAEVERLERHGIIVKSRAGVRLHDVVRPLFDDAADRRTWMVRAAGALTTHASTECKLDAPPQTRSQTAGGHSQPSPRP